MSIIEPEFEYVDRATGTIRYLEHGWPTRLCRWHSHEEYELHLMVATRGRAFVGDYIGDFQPGSLYLTGPNLPHNWVTDSNTHPEPVEVRDMLVQFSGDSLDHMKRAFPEFGELAPMWEMAKSGVEFVGFDSAFARGHMEGIRRASGAERIAAFLRFLVQANEHPAKKVLSVAGVIQAQDSDRQAKIADVVDYIVRNYAEKITLDQASTMANMSVTAFSRNFKLVTGSRFVEFLNRVRIGHACSLLYATDRQVSSICHDVGFRNLANFNRHFLKLKKMPPSAFRRLAQRNLVSARVEAA